MIKYLAEGTHLDEDNAKSASCRAAICLVNQGYEVSDGYELAERYVERSKPETEASTAGPGTLVKRLDAETLHLIGCYHHQFGFGTVSKQNENPTGD